MFGWMDGWMDDSIGPVQWLIALSKRASDWKVVRAWLLLPRNLQ